MRENQIITCDRVPPSRGKVKPRYADLRDQPPPLLLCSSTLVVLPVPRHKDLFPCARKTTGCSSSNSSSYQRSLQLANKQIICGRPKTLFVASTYERQKLKTILRNSPLTFAAPAARERSHTRRGEVTFLESTWRPPLPGGEEQLTGTVQCSLLLLSLFPFFFLKGAKAARWRRLRHGNWVLVRVGYFHARTILRFVCGFFARLCRRFPIK